MEREQFTSLREIALVTMPGELIRHSSWPENKTFACSTEFLHAFGNYPFANRGVMNLNNMPKVAKGGTWEHAGNYPVRVNTVDRSPRLGGVPHHVPVIKNKAA